MLPVGNVFFGFRVDVLLGQSKVYDVDDVLLLVALPADEEVLRLDVAVDEVLGMHVLHPRDLQKRREMLLVSRALAPSRAGRGMCHPLLSKAIMLCSLLYSHGNGKGCF